MWQVNSAETNPVKQLSFQKFALAHNSKSFKKIEVNQFKRILKNVLAFCMAVGFPTVK